MFFKKPDSKIMEVTINKKVHHLTLDNRWHELFKENKSRKIKSLENKLNNLIKEQGKLNNDYKEYTALKKKVMTDIVTNMSQACEEENNKAIENMDKNKNYITEINKKLDSIENRLVKLPQEIEQTNKSLLESSMADCYARMIASKIKINSYEEQVNELRNKLKELVIEKNENQEQYEKLYTYMHDLVGRDVIEQFDNMYLGGSTSD